MAELDEEGFQVALALLEEERVRGRRLLADVQEGRRCWEDLDPEERRVASGGALVDLALERSFLVRFEDPEKMVELAEAGCFVADHLGLHPGGGPAIADLRSRAWAELANAYRVGDHYRKAGKALSQARVLALRGTGSQQLMARIAELLAGFLIDRRRFKEAGDLLVGLEEAYRKEGKAEELAAILVTLGRLRGQAHEPEQAIPDFLRALEAMGPNSRLRLAAVHGLAVNLIEAGFPGAGQRVLDSNRRLYRRAGKLVEIRLWWAEGKAARALGQLGRAEGKLQVARLAFLRIKKDFDAALVSLDLGLVLASLERRKELAHLVEQMLATFRTLGLGREAIATLLLLKKSCEQSAPVERLCGHIEALSRMLPDLKRTKKRAARKAPVHR